MAPFFFLISPQRRPKRWPYGPVRPGNVINDFGLSEGHIFQSTRPTSGYIKGLVLLTKCQSYALICDRIQ
jgi:hypothetical protein